MNNPQWELLQIGKSGCYFLSILEGANRYLQDTSSLRRKIDILELYEKAVASGWIDADCFVNQPDKLAQEVICRKVSIRHASLDYEPKSNEIEITRYECKETGVTQAHFVLTRKKEILFDPYGQSPIVVKGYAVSKRILTVG